MTFFFFFLESDKISFPKKLVRQVIKLEWPYLRVRMGKGNMLPVHREYFLPETRDGIGDISCLCIGLGRYHFLPVTKDEKVTFLTCKKG